jgi:hAT family C-terminal dimerisation region
LYHLSKVDITSIECPLEWLGKNKSKYPNVAVGSRKWLSVCATSTPSERVFLISGLIDTPKRSTLTGEAIYKQVLIQNNWKSLNAPLERLGKVIK